MKITLIALVVALVLLAVPYYVFWRLDRRLLRQAVVVMVRVVVSLAVLAACLHFLFEWDKPWLNVLWVLLASGVATTAYCRKRSLVVPTFLGMQVPTQVVGIIVLLAANLSSLISHDSADSLSPFAAHLYIPVVTMMVAEALFVCRRGLAFYILNSRQHESLGEYLLGNGASVWQSRLPFVMQAVKRAFAPVMVQLLLVGVVFVPSLLAGLLVGGVQPLLAVAFLLLLTVGGLCCSVVSLMLAIGIYQKLA